MLPISGRPGRAVPLPAQGNRHQSYPSCSRSHSGARRARDAQSHSPFGSPQLWGGPSSRCLPGVELVREQSASRAVHEGTPQHPALHRGSCHPSVRSSINRLGCCGGPSTTKMYLREQPSRLLQRIKLPRDINLRRIMAFKKRLSSSNYFGAISLFNFLPGCRLQKQFQNRNLVF